MADLKSAVEKFSEALAEKVESFISDISVLEVRTYTATVTEQEGFVIAEKADVGQIATQGKLKLRAYTQIGFDGDTTICLPTSKTGEVDRSVWGMHQTMVNQAMQNRAEMLRSIGDAAASALAALQRTNE